MKKLTETWNSSKEHGSSIVASVADSVMSSGSNLVLTVAVARSVPRSTFGAFALAFAAYLIILGVSRGLSTDALLVRAPLLTESGEWSSAASKALGTSVLNGVWSGVSIVALGFFIERHFLDMYAAVGIAMPFALLQDAWRFIHFSQRRPRRALANDSVWTLTTILALILIALFSRLNAVYAIFAWAGGALIACFFGYFQTKLMPATSKAIRWVCENKDLSPYYVGEALLGGGSLQASLYLVGIIGGLNAAGAVKGGQTLVGPFTTLVVGVYAFSLPWFVSQVAKSKKSLIRPSLVLSVIISVLALLWGSLLPLIPDSIGVHLLGATWSTTRPLIVPATCWTIALSMAIGPQSALRARSKVRQSVLIRFIAAPVLIAAASFGSAINGGIGAMWGLAGGQLVSGVLWIIFCIQIEGKEQVWK